MKFIIRYSILLIFITVSTIQIKAQDLAEELAKVGELNAKNYVSPIFDGFAADLNSAFFHSADLHESLGFDIGIKFGMSLVKDADKKYNFVTPSRLNFGGGTLIAGVDYESSVPDVPTAVGATNAKKSVKMLPTSSYYQAFHDLHNDDVLFEIPDGFDLPAVPMPMLQAAIGLPLGLEVMVRFLPTLSAGDVGKINHMGFGLRYSIDQWIPLCPVDIAAHFMTQKINFKSDADKDIFKATGYAYGIEASKKLLFVTVYGGFQLEKASFTLSQLEGEFSTPDGSKTPFTIPEMTFDGKNKSRVTLGLRVLLAVVNIHAEYNIASNSVFAGGIGISLR
ncbi:MAG: hypothetical protein JXA06_00185 [Bacteroidetes bacterium]|nr:hypothetical protein [Bacteroidota bacterium]